MTTKTLSERVAAEFEQIAEVYFQRSFTSKDPKVKALWIRWYNRRMFAVKYLRQRAAGE